MSISLEQSDSNLALRLAQTEEQVKKLLGVVENLQAELKQQKKTKATTYDNIGDNIENNLSNNERNLSLGAEPIVNVPQIPVGEIWPFQENVEIDWEDLSLFDDISTFGIDLERNNSGQVASKVVEEVPKTTTFRLVLTLDDRIIA